jgi:nicotinamide-nucleotide amidase
MVRPRRRSAARLPTCRMLAVGDELILGRVVDTNSAWLAQWAGNRGLRVSGITAVGDGFDELVAALANACAQADLVVITGGLGPTEDDRTRHAVAAVMGVELVEDQQAWRTICRHFQRNNYGSPSPSNRRQALRPEGASLLPNDRGSAPGLWAKVGRCHVACLPGVPHEMEAMATRLGRRLAGTIRGLVKPTVKELWCVGLGESSAQERITGLLTEANPQVGITASDLGHLCLRVVGTPSEVGGRIRELRKRLREYLLPAPGLAASLILELGQRGETLAAAESCTGGQVVAQVTAVPGASTILNESLVTYHAHAKQRRLGVPAALIRRHGVVSQAVVEAMARGLKKTTDCHLAISTTGIAGPDGGSRECPVGTVWIAAAYGERVVSRECHIRGSRQRIQRWAAAQALAIGWQLVKASV